MAGVDIVFEAGGFTASMGPSGSGKSTLMHCPAGLDSATSGSITIAGKKHAAGWLATVANTLGVADRRRSALPAALLGTANWSDH